MYRFSLQKWARFVFRSAKSDRIINMKKFNGYKIPRTSAMAIILWVLFSCYSNFSNAQRANQLSNTQTANPIRHGLDRERLSRIDDYINQQIRAKHISGANALLIRNGEVVYNKSFGYADIESKRKMQSDDIFRIASQTKAITGLAAMMLWEEGKFLLDDPISKYIPEFKNPQVLVAFNEKDSSYTVRPASREITVRDLFRHTSGLSYQLLYIGDNRMAAIYTKAGVPGLIGFPGTTLAEKMKVLAKLPLLHNPGETFTYGLSVDVLGYLVEIWSGQSLDAFFRSRIFEPLEMHDTYFNLPKEKKNRLVSLYQPMPDGKLVKVDYPIYDNGNASYPTETRTYFSGGGGLSATIGDYAKLLTLFLQKGVYKTRRLLSPATVELMLTNQLQDGVGTSPTPPMPDNFQFGLGFELETAKNDYLAPMSIGSFMWAGAFGTYYWVDPKENLIGLFYTQEFVSPYWGDQQDEFKIVTYQAIN
jgi:CubicO group peptidase (beta-lactamase class C family)